MLACGEVDTPTSSNEQKQNTLQKPGGCCPPGFAPIAVSADFPIDRNGDLYVCEQDEGPAVIDNNAACQAAVIGSN